MTKNQTMPIQKIGTFDADGQMTFTDIQNMLVIEYGRSMAEQVFLRAESRLAGYDPDTGEDYILYTFGVYHIVQQGV